MQAHSIQVVADVRRFPASRRHPHFSRESLEPALAARSVDYCWLPALGGRRAPRADSANTGWRVAAFRGYADYMETPEFADALADLVELARSRRTAIMCAESLWWQCHRRLIADALLVFRVRMALYIALELFQEFLLLRDSLAKLSASCVSARLEFTLR